MRTWLDLARAGNFPSVASNVVAALALSSMFPGPLTLDFKTFFVALLAGVLSYAGGATLNDVADAHFDTRHRAERPIPRGKISRNAAFALVLAEFTLGAYLLYRIGSKPLAIAGMIVVVVLYDWLHKRWIGSVFLMAGCRTTLAICYATIPGNEITRFFTGWSAVLFVYIVVISVLARREYKTGDPTTGKSIARLLAFIPLVDAAALLLFKAWIPAAFCALMIPAGKWAQRKAAAT